MLWLLSPVDKCELGAPTMGTRRAATINHCIFGCFTLSKGYPQFLCDLSTQMWSNSEVGQSGKQDCLLTQFARLYCLHWYCESFWLHPKQTYENYEYFQSRRISLPKTVCLKGRSAYNDIMLRSHLPQSARIPMPWTSPLS